MVESMKYSPSQASQETPDLSPTPSQPNRFEAIQMRFDFEGVPFPVVKMVQRHEAVENPGEKRLFKKNRRILAPMISMPGYKWVSVVEPFEANKLGDRKVAGLTAYQSPSAILVFNGKYQSTYQLPENTIFGAHVRPNRKKR